MTEPDHPLGDVAAPGDGQNGVEPTPKSTTPDLTPMPPAKPTSPSNYEGMVGELSRLLEDARRVSARAVNAVMTATYWEMGRRIFEHEQGGRKRAGYGDELLARLASDLTVRFGRGFSLSNLKSARTFYLLWPISQTPSGQSPSAGVPEIGQTVSGQLATTGRPQFRLPWSRYVRLMTVK
jgi:hypothetical protein